MKLNKISLPILTALLGTGLVFSAQAQAKGRLVVYCSATNILCETTTKAFGDKYDVKTSFIRNGSGSTFAKVEAEKNNPQADVWFGGTFDPQAQAAELGLLHAYRSPNVDQIVERFQDPAKTKGNYASAIYMGILGFGVVDCEIGKPIKMITGGVISTPAHTPIEIRLEEIYNGLKEIITETKPDEVSIEKLFFSKNVTTAISVAQARGVAILVAQQSKIPISEYTPNQIKQTLTGYGSANKKQMQEMVRSTLNLVEVPKPDDAADALAAAITHFYMTRI